MNRAGDYGIPVPDYIEENVSTKVVKIIQGNVVKMFIGSCLMVCLRFVVREI